MPPRPPVRRHPTRQLSRYKIPALCLLVTLVLVGAILLLAGNLEPESLTDEQVLNKQTWGEEEIVQAASQRIHARRRQGGDPAVFKHLQQKIRALPADRQPAVRDAIMREAVNQGLREYRLLAADKRQEVIKRLGEQAARRRSEIVQGKPILPARMSAADREEEKRQAGRAVTHIMDSLTPDERRDLAPVVKEWVKIAENL